MAPQTDDLRQFFYRTVMNLAEETKYAVSQDDLVRFEALFDEYGLEKVNFVLFETLTNEPTIFPSTKFIADEIKKLDKRNKTAEEIH